MVARGGLSPLQHAPLDATVTDQAPIWNMEMREEGDQLRDILQQPCLSSLQVMANVEMRGEACQLRHAPQQINMKNGPLQMKATCLERL
eukprot:c29653_g1_i1 orf=43-309(+)